MAETRMKPTIEQFIKTRVCLSGFMHPNTLSLSQDARFLEFLSSLCVCSGRPIPSTQGFTLCIIHDDYNYFIVDRLLNELVICHGRVRKFFAIKYLLIFRTYCIRLI